MKLRRVVQTLALCCLALPAVGQASSSLVRFLGVSATARQGAVGLGQLNADCAAAYPRSRICTDADLVGAVPGPLPTTDAWFMMTVAHVDADNGLIFGRYGTILNQYRSDTGANCTSDRNGPFSGGYSTQEVAYLSTSGDISVTNCFDSLIVACCGVP